MRGSIRLRLTLWYGLTLAIVLSLFAATAWVAMRSSVIETVDHDLRGRITDIADFIRGELEVSRSELDQEFAEHALLGLGGGLLQVTDSAGRLLFRSSRFTQLDLQSAIPPTAASGLTFRTVGNESRKYRASCANVTVKGQSFTVCVAEPLHEFDEAVERFERILLVAVPLFILLASIGGFWISGRALSPVDKIINDARRISIGSLSRRLKLPSADDELRRLAQTLNEMLDRIERAVSRIVQFTADASHELRAPLTLIQTAAEFSIRRDRSREELVEAMTKIHRESQRTSRLVDDLLLLARADSDNDQLDLLPVDALSSVRLAVEQARTLAEPKGIQILPSLPPGNAVVLAEESTLSRLWLILLDNAIKYTDAGGSVCVGVQCSSNNIVITVSDTGVGIARQDLSHVFERFWRADKVRSRSMGGAGLGLSIARWITERLGGTIEIQSEPGSGTDVVVRLNLFPDGHSTGPQAATRVTSNPPA